MSFFEQFPYTNFHELNLDWIIRTLKELDGSLTDFVKLNTIKYANPIEHDITRSYETNTVVVDSHSGNAYISVKPVPNGVSIDNTEYWTEIFNYVNDVDKVISGISHNNKNSATATADIADGSMFWYYGNLYQATKDITAGDQIVVGSNCRAVTLNELLKNEIAARISKDSELQTNLNNVSGTLQSKDAELQTNIDKVQTNLNSVSVAMQTKDMELQTNINRVQTNLDNVSGTLQSKDAELQTNINNVSGTLQYMINGIYNKYQKNNVVVIGDSFCADWYSFPKKSWAHRLKDLIGSDNFRIYSYGGAGYVGKDNVNAKTYQQNFDDYVKSDYANTKNDVTLVILSGGVNDTEYNPSYQKELDAAKNFILDVQDYFPNAKIVGLNCVALNKIARNVVCGINFAFDSLGIPNTTFAMAWLLGKSDFFLEDKLHPNDLGQDFIAKKFYSFLMTGNDSIADRYNFVSDGVSGGIIWSIEDLHLHIFGRGILSNSINGNRYRFPNKLPAALAPAHIITQPVYSDAGIGTYFNMLMDGTMELILLNASSLPNGFGVYRVDFDVNLNDK